MAVIDSQQLQKISYNNNNILFSNDLFNTKKKCMETQLQHISVNVPDVFFFLEISIIRWFTISESQFHLN